MIAALPTAIQFLTCSRQRSTETCPIWTGFAGFGASGGDSRAKLSPLQAIFFQLLLGRAYDDKDVQEAIVRRGGLDWIIARPVILTSGPKTGRYKVLCAPKDWRSGTISRADVADFLVKQVQDRTYLGKTPVLTN